MLESPVGRTRRGLRRRPSRPGRGPRGRRRCRRSRPHHPSSVGACGQCRVDAGVELVGGDLEVVPQRGVPLGQHRPDRPRVRVPAQDPDHLEHAGVLGHDVPCPAQQDVVLEADQTVDVGDVAQRRDTQARGGLLALAAAVAVAAVGVGVRRPGVDDEQLEPPGRQIQRHLLRPLLAGVEEQRVACGAQQRRRLVEDPGRGAHEVVLRPAGQLDQIGAAELGGDEVPQSQGDRAGQGRRGRQPGTHGDVSVDEHAHAAAQPVPQPLHHAGRVARPAAGPAGDQLVDGQLHDLAVALQGGQGDPPVGAPPHRGAGRVRQRDGQHVAVVVVGVLADDVDPARCRPDAFRFAREPLAERSPRAVGRRRVVVHATTTARSCSATSSGFVSVMNAPIPDSEPARYFSLPGARRNENSCRCNHQSSRPARTGAWFQDEM